MNITELTLDADQRRGLALALEGRNLFLTGAAGSGKSALLAVLLDRLGERGRVPALTASTGIAALNIGGRTVHSFLGTKICSNVAAAKRHLSELKEREPDRLDKARWRLGGTDVIVVDEVSMLTGDFIDMMDWWLRELLARPDEPFAGRQVVFVGDFFQLPPVIKRGDRVERELAFESLAWWESGVETVMLTHNHRQANDRPFKAALDSLRSGAVSVETAAYFARCVGRELDEPTVLFPTNSQVAHVNAAKLAALPGELYTLHAAFDGPEWACKQLAKLCYVDKVIDIKNGAAVILARNVYEQGEECFVNGDRGVVVERRNGKIIVQLERDGGREVDVRRECFELRKGSGKIVATMRQHPIKLAYALSIHKSQGMTLPRVRCDLGRCFAEGQAYTALSRARNARGLSLARGLEPRSVFAHPRCVAFYEMGGRVRFVGRKAVG